MLCVASVVPSFPTPVLVSSSVSSCGPAVGVGLEVFGALVGAVVVGSSESSVVRPGAGVALGASSDGVVCGLAVL